MSGRTIATLLADARAAGERWRAVPPGERLRIIGAARRRMVGDMPRLLAAFGPERPPAETLSAEILPLADAARFLERQAARILAPRPPRGRRPPWLAGVRAEIRREPCGVVLILAPGNFPLFLAGAQILQALAAGNAVCVKPPEGRAAPLTVFSALLAEAGLPDGVLRVLDEAAAIGEAAVRAGFDKIFLTGSAATGGRVLAAAAENLTPCVMELSGNDPVFVLEAADLDLTARCLAYGLGMNGGATCIAPRLVLVPHAAADGLERVLRDRLACLPARPSAAAADRLRTIRQEAEAAGARVLASREAGPLVLADAPPPLRRAAEDFFGPLAFVIRVADIEEALAVAAESGYALGAAIFGPEAAAQSLAPRVDAGSVVINDLIVPTADPRLPFGGRRRSGFGLTRGAEGLLEMTVTKTVSVRRGRFRPHLNNPDAGSPDAGNPAQVAALIRAVHASAPARIRAIFELVRASRASR